MNIRLIALDLDGTLLTSSGTIAAESVQAIQEAMKKGVRVALATGRPYPFAKAVAKSIGLNAPVIAHDGAYAADPYTDKVFFVRRIPAVMAVRILQALFGLPLQILCVHETRTVVNWKMKWTDLLDKISELNLLKYHLAEKYDYLFLPPEQLESYVLRQPLSPLQIFLAGKNRLLRLARERLEHPAWMAEIRVTSSDYGLEILPASISKASGLAAVGRHLGIRPREIMACGDQRNDLEMLQYAGLGIAMGNAPAEIQGSADWVTKTNDEHGVAEAIRHWILSA